MAVKLRLRREGTVKRPHYRIVAADSRAPRDGRFIEVVGSYHPLDEPSTIRVDADRALHWLRNGAQPTESVERLLRIAGVWEAFKPGDAPKRDRSGVTKTRMTRKARARAAEAAEAAASAAAAAAEAAAAPAQEPEAVAVAEAEPAAPAEAEPEAAAPAEAEPEASESPADQSDEADEAAEA